MNSLEMYSTKRRNPLGVKLRVEFQNERNKSSFELTISPFAKFAIFIQFVKEQIFTSQQTKYLEGTLYYFLEQGTILDNEQKALGELGFTNNSTLKITTCIKSSYIHFKINTKSSTFSFQIVSKENQEFQQFDEAVKQCIYQLSGLEAKKDYIDPLIYIARSTFCLNEECLNHTPIASQIFYNTNFEVNLSMINQ